MVLTPGTNPKEIDTLERVQNHMTRLLEHNPKDLTFDAMRSAIAIRGQVEEIYAASDQPAVRNAALVILNQMANLEEQVSNLGMVADLQQDVINMNIDVVNALGEQRDELREELDQARSEVEQAFDDGYRAGVEMAGYGADPDAYDDDEEPEDEGELFDERPDVELSEADLKARQFDRWAAWHDSLTDEEREAYRAGLDDEQRAWYDDWAGHAS